MIRETFVWYFMDPKKDNRTLREKVQECAEAYKQKMGEDANLCLLHAETMGDSTIVGEIELRVSKTVQKNNYLLTRVDVNPTEEHT